MSLFAILVSIVLFIKWLLGIDDIDALKRILSGLSSGRQHWVSSLFQVLLDTFE